MYKTHKTAEPRGQPQENLRISTVRSFEGGLNVVDTDLNMSPKFAKVLDNLERGFDGSLSVRPGTKLLKNVAQLDSDSSNIINCTYFNGEVITVQASGHVKKTNGAGNTRALKIAGANPWGATVTFVSFTVFNSDLIIVDGKDKPLLISGDPGNVLYMELDYLKDLANGNNINTPVGLYVVSHSQYTCMAGFGAEPSTLYVSAKGTSGTWPLDSAPNDAIAIDLGPRVSVGSSTITGMVAYRDKLLVTFERGVLPVNLGVYTGTPAVHTPSDDGFIEEFGCLAHRSLISVGDDTFYCDNVGVNSINRINTFSTLRPVRSSQLIDPEITALIQPLTQQQIAQYVFAVFDLRNFRYMLFVPRFDEHGAIEETIGFSYTNVPVLKIQAWARLRGWVWQCGCRTQLQNVIFANGSTLYSYNFDAESTAADFVGDTRYEAAGLGVPIDFEWELPWADFDQRMWGKVSRYVALDTQGSGPFTLYAYVDNIRMDADGQDAPMLVMDFVGGQSGGFGNTPYGDTGYGGGRRSSDERLWGWTAKFNLLKLVFRGSTTLPLRFVAVSIAYVRGKIRR